MTLGIATCDEHGIYVAIESQGIPLAGPRVKHEFRLLLDSKILQLNIEPQVIVLAAGGLEHWAYVAANYASTSSVSDATLEIVRLLDSCMTKDNQAFGLACGYENGSPKCYRINRGLNCQKTDEPIEERLSDIQVLGKYEAAAKKAALHAIEGKEHPLVALVETIEALFPKPGIRPPVHSRVMRPER